MPHFKLQASSIYANCRISALASHQQVQQQAGQRRLGEAGSMPPAVRAALGAAGRLPLGRGRHQAARGHAARERVAAGAGRAGRTALMAEAPAPRGAPCCSRHGLCR